MLLMHWADNKDEESVKVYNARVNLRAMLPHLNPGDVIGNIYDERR